MGRDPVAQFSAGVERFRLGDRRSCPIVSLGFRATSAARLEQPVNICEVERAACARAARLVLKHDGKIPIAAPFGRNERVRHEDVRAAPLGAEIFLQTLEHSQVRRDDDEMLRHLRTTFPERMEVAPHNGEAHALGLARARGELEGVARPLVIFGLDSKRFCFRVRSAELEDEGRQRVHPPDLDQIDKGLDGLALTEIIAKVELLASPADQPVRSLEPMGQ